MKVNPKLIDFLLIVLFVIVCLWVLGIICSGGGVL